MMIESNPFNSPEFRKQLLEKEGIDLDNNNEVELIDSEEGEGGGDGFDIKSMIKSAPKMPKSAKNLITDASVLAKNQKEAKALELKNSLNTVFTQYNEKYGTDLNIDFDNLSNTLVNVSSPEKRRILELYVSEVFRSIRPVLLLHVLQRLTIALDYALDPTRLLDTNQFSAADSVILVEKLIQFIGEIEDMIKEIEIPDSDKILRKLADEKNDVSFNDPENKQVITDFLNMLKNDSIKKE
jgi:hypothetical protein